MHLATERDSRQHCTSNFADVQRNVLPDIRDVQRNVPIEFTKINGEHGRPWKTEPKLKREEIVRERELKEN